MSTLSRSPIHQPWLVQTARLKTPLADPKTSTLSNSVDFDYMGSAEFEFGALPKSLRRLREARDGEGLISRTVTGIRDGERALRVLSRFDDKEFKEYTGYLYLLRQGGLRLKESSKFQEDWRPLYECSVVDFWWDTDNDVMWTFNKNYMRRLPGYLRNSFEVMAK